MTDDSSPIHGHWVEPSSSLGGPGGGAPGGSPDDDDDGERFPYLRRILLLKWMTQQKGLYPSEVYLMRTWNKARSTVWASPTIRIYMPTLNRTYVFQVLVIAKIKSPILECLDDMRKMFWNVQTLKKVISTPYGD